MFNAPFKFLLWASVVDNQLESRFPDVTSPSTAHLGICHAPMESGQRGRKLSNTPNYTVAILQDCPILQDCLTIGALLQTRTLTTETVLHKEFGGIGNNNPRPAMPCYLAIALLVLLGNKVGVEKRKSIELALRCSYRARACGRW